MKAPPDKTVVLRFMSHPTKDLRMRWQATLAFPAGSVGSASLPVEVVDGNGEPVKKGVLELFGAGISVKNGKGKISYRKVVAGKHETGVWLHRDGFLPIPGGLTFG